MKPKILLIEDEEATRFGFTKYLSRSGYIVQEASCLSDAHKALLSQRFDAVLLDLNLPDGSGLEWIIEFRENYPDIPIIVITGFGDIPIAVDAMRRGADNFLTKPVNMQDLDIFLRKSLELGTLRRKNLTSQRLEKKDQIYFGESPAMKKVMNLAALSAKNDSPVILLGETGAGKGILARWLHDNSLCSSAPFVEVNCSSLRGDLLASELFGHARGAFTTAVQDKQGLIEVADGGTLFLDEISDMDIGVQAQFLKVIEEKHYRRVGEVKVRRSEFRLICATNRDLLEETHHGRFRKDLYFRINVLPIVIPSLRERQEDMPGLVLHLLRNLGAPNVKISSEAMQLLKAYPWPGNIRELRNVLERGLLLAYGQSLTLEHFSSLESQPVFMSHDKDMNNLENIEEAHIREAVRRFSGDTRKAAESLGISRATLYRKLKKFQQTPK
ncbi:MAG: sigma-54 dependent transcriptional regulator [Thermodesulfovibrionales bacterium]